MRGLNTLFASAALLAGMAMVPAAQAQIVVGVGVGIQPVCQYGYYDYAPYACSPYGFYGPGYFYNGIFLGMGPWAGWGYGHGWGGHRFENGGEGTQRPLLVPVAQGPPPQGTPQPRAPAPRTQPTQQPRMQQPRTQRHPTHPLRGAAVAAQLMAVVVVEHTVAAANTSSLPAAEQRGGVHNGRRSLPAPPLCFSRDYSSRGGHLG
jgi:hypothetical protein